MPRGESGPNTGDAQDAQSTRLTCEGEISTRPVETTLYSDDRGIRFTKTILMFGDTTYPLANLTSVKVERTATSHGLFVLLFLFLLVCILGLAAEGTSLSAMGGAGTLIFAIAFVATGVQSATSFVGCRFAVREFPIGSAVQ